MGKKQKYSEDELLGAVVKYAEIEKQTIKATELAKWCRRNIIGLEEVRDYHFMRTRRVLNEKTGKMDETKKLCTLKIEEINNARSIVSCTKVNLLLKASNINHFLNLSDIVKRKLVEETRETVDELFIRNRNLENENKVLKEQNKNLQKENVEKEEKIKKFQKEKEIFLSEFKYLKKYIDEMEGKRMLLEMGIKDESFSIMTYRKSLQKSSSELVNVDARLRKCESILLSKYNDDKNAVDNEKNLKDTVMEGLDF